MRKAKKRLDKIAALTDIEAERKTMDSEPQQRKDTEMPRDLRPSSSGVYGWLKGDNIPNANNLRLIVRVLKCTLDDLYENDKFSSHLLAQQLELNKLSRRDFADKLLFASKGLDI